MSFYGTGLIDCTDRANSALVPTCSASRLSELLGFKRSCLKWIYSYNPKGLWILPYSVRKSSYSSIDIPKGICSIVTDKIQIPSETGRAFIASYIWFPLGKQQIPWHCIQFQDNFHIFFSESQTASIFPPSNLFKCYCTSCFLQDQKFMIAIGAMARH